MCVKFSHMFVNVYYCICVSHCRICLSQKGRPLPSSNICQLTLKYMLIHRAIVVKNWRNRLYYSSSGSIFNLLKPKLESWVAYNRERDLLRIKDVDGLWAILGEAVFLFYQAKAGPYRDLCTSKRGFKSIPDWRRAITFVFLLR